MNLFIQNKKTLEMKKISIRFIISIILIFGLFFRLGYLYGFDDGKKSEITEKDVVLLYQDSENHGFSKKKFYEYLREVNVKFPEIVFAQAMKESGFKSSLFKNNNNPFGMKEAGRRPNMQSGTQNGYGYYDTWKNSIVDYALYQSCIGVNKIKSEDEYLIYLKEMNYYDVNHPNNKNYLTDLRYIADNIKDYFKE